MNKLRIVLAVLLLLVTLQGSWYFLGMRHSGIKPWLMFNACAVANITFLIGLVVYLYSGSRIIMYLTVLPLFFFSHTRCFWQNSIIAKNIVLVWHRRSFCFPLERHEHHRPGLAPADDRQPWTYALRLIQA